MKVKLGFGVLLRKLLDIIVVKNTKFIWYFWIVFNLENNLSRIKNKKTTWKLSDGGKYDFDKIKSYQRKS